MREAIEILTKSFVRNNHLMETSMKSSLKLLASASFMGICLVLSHTNAFAFAETTDKTEVYTILPNQSAFWVPDVGDNKGTQKKFESEDYYNDAKIAAKRFQVPHQKLIGSGGTGWGAGWDLYVPTGRLFIVDRTPYSREWVDAADRGTSKEKQGFPCQSKEGVNITAGVSIGVSVVETDAAKFLYNYGVTSPQGDPSDAHVIFTSVFYGRSLTNVMDDVGRKKVQTLVCDEIGKRTFNQANAEMIPIMQSVESESRDFFAKVGITLNFIGWGDTFSFDPDVQHAVNQRYIAEELAPVIPELQGIAQIKIQEGLGTGLDKHGLPVVIPQGIIDSVIGLAKTFGTQVDHGTPAVLPTPKSN
jgi:hypothetical protein